MFKRIGLAAIMAVVLAGSSFFGLHSSGSKAEAACLPGDAGCNPTNNLLFLITNASNATSVFVPEVFGPVVLVPQTILVPAPIITVPVVTPLLTPFTFPFFAVAPCSRLSDFGFCPSLFSSQLALSGFSPFFGPGFNPFLSPFFFP